MLNIDTNTKITTAARRIQRRLKGFEGFQVWFNLDGDYITCHEKGLWPANLQTWQEAHPEAKVSFFGGKCTQREIQDELDARKAWENGEVQYVIDYSEQLQAARMAERD